MPLTIKDWHARFVQQAGWTRDLRNYLFQRADCQSARRILEVGCGTGVILDELTRVPGSMLFGVDLDIERLRFASDNTPGTHLVAADGRAIPFRAGSFDVSLCHFLLLWVRDPLLVVQAMKRVTRPGGAVIAAAEPDYGGRIDFPEALSEIGRRQGMSLAEQGADPQIGRKLAGLFHEAGLKDIETGVLGAQWSKAPSREDFDLEWAVLRDDMQVTFNREEIEKIRSLEIESWERGERVLFVPTFYAWGRV